MAASYETVGPIPVIKHAWVAAKNSPATEIVFFELLVPVDGEATISVDPLLVREYQIGMWAYGNVYEVKV